MIWNPFKGRGENYQLGIDIGTSSIKVVELLLDGGKVKLSNYGAFYTAGHQNAIQSRSLKMLDQQVANILKNIFQQAGITGKKASIAIPIFSSFSTLIHLPAMPQEELSKAVRYEARKYVPVPINEVQFDWMRVDHLSDEKSIKILTVAVPNELIEKYDRIAKLLGIELVNVELETFSAARSLVSGDSSPAMVLDVGSRNTNMSITEKGLVLVHHNLDVSGLSFTQVLSRGLSIDMNRAEELKRKNGLSAQGEISDLLRPLVDKIISEIEKTIEEYINQGGTKPMRIILNGGSAAMPGLSSYLQSALKIKVEKGNPFSNIEVPRELNETLAKDGPEFTVATGLALRAE